MSVFQITINHLPGEIRESLNYVHWDLLMNPHLVLLVGVCSSMCCECDYTSM